MPRSSAASTGWMSALMSSTVLVDFFLPTETLHVHENKMGLYAGAADTEHLSVQRPLALHGLVRWPNRGRRSVGTQKEGWERGRERELVNWSFEPGQPLGIISGLRETFIKRCRPIVERTNKPEIRPEEQSQKAESCWENLWNEIQLKGP